MNKHTSSLVLSLFTACAFALVAAAEEPAPPPSDPIDPVPRDRDYSWMAKAEWEKLHAEFSAVAAKGEAKLVFYGDSLLGAARWSEAWKKEFGQYAPAIFGMGGDRTQNLLWRLDNGEIGALKPKVVVLLIGTNNIHTTPRDVEEHRAWDSRVRQETECGLSRGEDPRARRVSTRRGPGVGDPAEDQKDQRAGVRRRRWEIDLLPGHRGGFPRAGRPAFARDLAGSAPPQGGGSGVGPKRSRRLSTRT
jgi:hypothetical protein